MSIVDINNKLLLLLIQNHVLTVIVDTKTCACLMALLTKIMRCILQVRAQEQPSRASVKYHIKDSVTQRTTYLNESQKP